MKIVILTLGWVYVGQVAFEDNFVVIRNAKNIRRWGTTAGLGELALKGPQPQTKLDESGTVRAPLNALIATLDCEASAWKQ